MKKGSPNDGVVAVEQCLKCSTKDSRTKRVTLGDDRKRETPPYMYSLNFSL